MSVRWWPSRLNYGKLVRRRQESIAKLSVSSVQELVVRFGRAARKERRWGSGRYRVSGFLKESGTRSRNIQGIPWLHPWSRQRRHESWVWRTRRRQWYGSRYKARIKLIRHKRICVHAYRSWTTVIRITHPLILVLDLVAHSSSLEFHRECGRIPSLWTITVQNRVSPFPTLGITQSLP